MLWAGGLFVDMLVVVLEEQPLRTVMTSVQMPTKPSTGSPRRERMEFLPAELWYVRDIGAERVKFQRT